MEALFDIHSPAFSEKIWNAGPSIQYRNPGDAQESRQHLSHQYLLQMGRNNARFIQLPLEYVTIWSNRYHFLEACTVHARAPYRSLELLFVRSGKLVRHIWPFRHLPLETGSVSLIHSLAIDNKTTFDKDRFYQTLDLHFTPKGLGAILAKQPRQLERLLNEYEAGRQISFLSDKFRPTPEIITMADKIENYIFNPEMQIETMSNLALCLLLKVLSLQQEQFGIKNLDARLRPRIRLIEQVAGCLLYEIDKREITLKALSAKAGTNEKYFAAGFHYLYGMGVKQFMKRMRLDRTLHLLLTTELPVKDVAALAGYNHPHQIYPRFKAVYNETPEGYRKVMKELASTLYLPHSY